MYGVGKTHAGLVRANNEDSVFASNQPIGHLPNLFVVADGMGGHSAGEVASRTAVEFFLRYSKERHCNYNELLDYIVEGCLYANNEVYKLSRSDDALNGMGTTFSVCVFHDGKAFIAHVGDSRVYIIGGGRIVQLTNDHTYVDEMLRAGEITAEEAKTHPNRHMLTRVMGFEPDTTVDARVDRVYLNDKILICSDGLSNMVSDAEMYEFVTKPISTEEKADGLIELANAAGGLDNVSVALIEI